MIACSRQSTWDLRSVHSICVASSVLVGFPRRARRKLGFFTEEAAICARLAGLRGLTALSAHLVSGSPNCVAFELRGLQHPVFLRLRTSDAKVCKEVLLDREYFFSVPFTPRTILDVGANCGMTAIFYANQYPDAHIWAVEPEPSNFTALLRNTRLYDNITAVQAAVWHEDGEVELFAPWPKFRSWGKWGFAARSGHGCRSITIATLMREIGIEAIDILKMDVEGAEREIFASCDWLDKVGLLAIELHDRTHPGCTEIVDAAARGRVKKQKQFVTFYR